MHRWKYNEYGNAIERNNYGVDEQLKEDVNGVAMYRHAYDEHGKKTETKRYDKREWPIGE